MRGKDLRLDVSITPLEALLGLERQIEVSGMFGGTSRRARRFAVKIPAAVRSGTVLRLRGRGEMPHGADEPGDILVTVHVQERGNRSVKSVKLRPVAAPFRGFTIGRSARAFLALALAWCTFGVISGIVLRATDANVAFPAFLMLVMVPIGFWLAAFGRNALRRADLVLFRAGSDVYLSAAIGVNLVVLLVAIANLAELPVEDVRQVRETLDGLSRLTDVPAWLWIAVYTALALLNVGLALHRERLSVRSLFARIVSVAGSSTSAIDGAISKTHIAFLAATLVGVSTLPALPAALQATRSELQQRYTLALHDELESTGMRAALEEMGSRGLSPDDADTLRSLIAAVDTSSAPSREVAGELGRTQARAVGESARLADGGAGWSRQEAEAAFSAFDRPITTAGDIDRRASKVAAEEAAEKTARVQLARAGEQVTTALANVISIPSLGDQPQLLQEYIMGIIEENPVKDRLFEWAKRRWLGEQEVSLPTGPELLVPDMSRLQKVASSRLRAEVTKTFPSEIVDSMLAYRDSDLADLSPTDSAVRSISDIRTLEDHESEISADPNRFVRTVCDCRVTETHIVVP